MSENPYSAPAKGKCGIETPRVPRHPSVAKMWLGFAVAPIVAPLAFVLLLWLVFLFSRALNFRVNHASFVVLPALALSVGVVASYGVAGLIGMPLAFFLRHRGQLNAINIHVCALGWACVWAITCQFLVHGGNITAADRLIWPAYVGLGTAAPILLSATVFWLIVRHRTEG